ncbi:hypothetical protein PHMEG_00019851 [Phytophthora megakarya]|uniref:Uncharacterized protein n=1 Tax=Phytophthora megakarya TaxID=4795 RepID=A0A225VQL1_9STRA|nr:hypothetical protein PHMEG_00019851 [Phytophthora megakarya]
MTTSESDHAVIGMYFAQNLTVPSVSTTPSQWYSFALVATNYVYDETSSGEGSHQINWMLTHFIRTKIVPAGKTRLTCTWDNSSTWTTKVFVKGHTKNSCDRDFGHIRKHRGKVDIWTMGHLVEAVSEASRSSNPAHPPRNLRVQVLEASVYTTMQQYQIFSADEAKPGVVICKKSPDSETNEVTLCLCIDGILTTKEKVKCMLTDYI